MSPYSYKAMALLPPSVVLSMPELAERLSKTFGAVELSADQTKIAKTIQNPANPEETWSFRLYLENKPHVIFESREMADKFAQNRPDKAVIVSCDRRLFLGCDPDPNMDFFNDYVIIVQILDEIEGAIVFDPNNGKFFDEF
jgi:hypothetical protein